MTDPISRLRGLTSEIKGKELELRAHFSALEQSLRDASGGYSVCGQSEKCILEPLDEDDAYYGYLFFSEDKLAVAYRTREDDMELAISPDPWKEGVYSTKKISECDLVWLRSLSAPTVAASLHTSITTRQEEELAAIDAAIQTLSATANLPLRDVDKGLVDAAKKLNFDAVIQHWKDAQTALGVDPPDATTRASSLIETLCKHILTARKVSIPQTETIQHLYRAAAKTLSLALDKHTTDDLKAIANGMTALVGGIGALRTHAGTAHGRVPGHQPITFSQARLAVNVAGVLATFLMDSLIAETEAKSS